MKLPFSHSEFLDVFGSYNSALWPAVVLLWIITAFVLLVQMRRAPKGSRAVTALLGAHWLWSGVAYHWVFFRSINPAAAIFGGLFVIQGMWFAWLALAGRQVQFDLDHSFRGAVALALILYALLYPLVGVAFGLRYPRMPVFGVPCPTTILTAGVLLLGRGFPRFVSVIPIVWSAIGGSAALVLGITADLALVVAGALLALQTAVPRLLGARRTV